MFGNSLLGAALGLWSLLLIAGCAGPSSQPDVILITLDTTRADHLSSYGYPRDTSPHLDALAAIGDRHTRALSTSSWTLPAHASLFTGQFPRSHGARYDPAGPLLLTDAIEGPESWSHYRARGLGGDVATLAEQLAQAGWSTGGVVAGPWMVRLFGLDRGFDHWDDSGIDTVRGRLAVSVTDAALSWIDTQADRSVLLFLNYYDPHTPYGAPEPFGDHFVEAGMQPQALRLARYDGEIRYMDHQIGRLFDGLRRRDRFDDAWIIVTADHGELLGEHGQFGHGRFLSQPELHVPLIVKRPGRNTAQVHDDWIQLTDIPALLLDELGLDLPASIQGAAAAGARPRPFAEVYPLPSISQLGDFRMRIDSPYKVAWNSLGRHLLFDLEQDPQEQRNLAVADETRTRAMLQQLDLWFRALPLPTSDDVDAAPVDAETLERLRGLGYVGN